MTKLLTVTTELENCGECVYVDTLNCKSPWWCFYGEDNLFGGKKRRIRRNIWNGFPEWCPLVDKPGNK